MAIELVGKKIGMSRMLFDDGSATSVTLIEVLPNIVVQVKTVESDGYSALKLASGAVKSSYLSKSQAGLFKKAGIEGHASLREVRLSDLDGYNVGDKLSLKNLQVLKKLIFKVFLKEKALLVVLRGGTLECRMQHMATLYRIEL